MISVEGVSKTYKTLRGPRTVLEGVNFRIERGQKVGILGRNGAGKSTLIRLIGGADVPSTGRIRRTMTVSWPLAFGGAFQPNLTGFDNLRFICRVYGVPYENVVSFVEDFTDLGIYLREPVTHYSEGMRARLAFALSLAIEFDCFLIDEVIAVGDSRFHEKCKTELFEKRKDRAFIIVSHDPNVIRTYCESAYVLASGKLHSFAGVDDAYAFYEGGNSVVVRKKPVARPATSALSEAAFFTADRFEHSEDAHWIERGIQIHPSSDAVAERLRPQIYGPYIAIEPGIYVAKFCFECNSKSTTTTVDGTNPDEAEVICEATTDYGLVRLAEEIRPLKEPGGFEVEAVFENSTSSQTIEFRVFAKSGGYSVVFLGVRLFRAH
jgi:capsular polysaccharide transport system ATP-binding protein